VEGGKELPQNVKAIADVSKEQVKDAVSKLNDYVQSTERTLDFKMDEDSGKTVIKVYDTLSAELIRQIPNELALELAQNLNDEEPSLLFSAQV
jgi:flagellar protein FlaG